MIDFVFSSLFTTSTQVLISLIVIYSVYEAGNRGILRDKLVFWILGLDILYVAAAMYVRYTSGHISVDVHTERFYPLLASLHGTISLFAWVLTVVYFKRARVAMDRGVNYFRELGARGYTIVILWLLALISGIIL